MELLERILYSGQFQNLEGKKAFSQGNCSVIQPAT